MCIKNLKDNGFQIWATDLASGAISIDQIGLQSNQDKLQDKDILHWVRQEDKVALVFGNEVNGISQEIRDNAGIALNYI